MVQYNTYYIATTSPKGGDQFFYICTERVRKAVEMVARAAPNSKIKQIQKLKRKAIYRDSWG